MRKAVIRGLLALLLVLSISFGATGSAVAQDGGEVDNNMLARAMDRLDGMMGGVRAQGGGDDGQEDDQQGEGTITKTFQLTLNGDVPEGESFPVVFVSVNEAQDSAILGVIVLCGQVPDQDQIEQELAEIEAEAQAEGVDLQTVFIASDADCTGGGTVYSASVELPSGNLTFSAFFRVSEANPDGELVFENEEVLTTNFTNKAFYNFGGAGTGDEQPIPELPNTGAGGMAPTGAPVGGMVAAITTLALAALRWRGR